MRTARAHACASQVAGSSVAARVAKCRSSRSRGETYVVVSAAMTTTLSGGCDRNGDRHAGAAAEGGVGGRGEQERDRLVGRQRAERGVGQVVDRHGSLLSSGADDGKEEV